MGTTCHRQVEHQNVYDPKTNSTIPQQPIIQTAEPSLPHNITKKIQELGYLHKLQNLQNPQLKPQCYKLKNGLLYEGFFHEGKMEGFGRCLLPNQCFLEGQFKNNQCQGQARIISDNGDYYIGQIKKNKANGKGKYVSNEVVFEGYFHNNLKEGKGKETGPNFEFDGIYQKGERVFGKLVQKQGLIYEGGIKNNKYHGKGMLIDSRGRYDGQFSNGLRNGIGKQMTVDGQIQHNGKWIRGDKQVPRK